MLLLFIINRELNIYTNIYILYFVLIQNLIDKRWYFFLKISKRKQERNCWVLCYSFWIFYSTRRPFWITFFMFSSFCIFLNKNNFRCEKNENYFKKREKVKFLLKKTLKISIRCKKIWKNLQKSKRRKMEKEKKQKSIFFFLIFFFFENFFIVKIMLYITFYL